MKEQINKDFMTAWKAGEKEKKTFLGVLKGEIELEASRENGDTPEQIIKKMNKSLLAAIKNGDEAAKTELEFLSVYLPKMMSEQEITDIVTQLVANGATNIGMVMKEFNMNFKGMADNNVVRTVTIKLI